MTDHVVLHPAARIAAALGIGLDKFCPDCGHRGVKVRDLEPPFEEWACPDCEPEVCS
jgi:hypothetical protein